MATYRVTVTDPYDNDLVEAERVEVEASGVAFYDVADALTAFFPHRLLQSVLKIEVD